MSCINTVVLFRSCSKIFYLVTSNVCTCRRSLSRSTLWWLSREAEAKTNPVTTHLEEVDPATTQWRQQPAARCFWLLRWHLSAIDVVFFFLACSIACRFVSDALFRCRSELMHRCGFKSKHVWCECFFFQNSFCRGGGHLGVLARKIGFRKRTWIYLLKLMIFASLWSHIGRLAARKNVFHKQCMHVYVCVLYEIWIVTH